MTTARRVWPWVSLLLLLFCFALRAHAATQTVGIKLEDSTTDPAVAHMRIMIDRASIKPGRVTLQAVNESKNLVHEVLVVKDEGQALPMDTKEGRVAEKRIHSLGEISDLAPGKSGKLTLNLKPGTYLLLCNEPGHYQDGMQVKLTVG